MNNISEQDMALMNSLFGSSSLFNEDKVSTYQSRTPLVNYEGKRFTAFLTRSSTTFEYKGEDNSIVLGKCYLNFNDVAHPELGEGHFVFSVAYDKATEKWGVWSNSDGFSDKTSGGAVQLTILGRILSGDENRGMCVNGLVDYINRNYKNLKACTDEQKRKTYIDRCSVEVQLSNSVPKNELGNCYNLLSFPGAEGMSFGTAKAEKVESTPQHTETDRQVHNQRKGKK